MGSTFNSDEMNKCVSSVNARLQDILNEINSLKNSIESVRRQYESTASYDGKYMEDKDTQYLGDGHGGGKKIVISYQANMSSGSGAGGAFSSIDEKINNVSKISDSISSELDNVSVAASVGDSAVAEITTGLIGSVGGGVMGGSGSYGISGSSNYKSFTPSSYQYGHANNNSETNTSNSNSSSSNYNAEQDNLNQVSNLENSSIVDSLEKSKNEKFNSSNNPNLTNNLSNSSNSSTRSNSHSGGGYSASGGYKGDDKNREEGNNLLDNVATSVEDIIRSGKKRELASSSIPILGIDKVSGNSVVPIASSIGAAGATGIGLSSYFGKKKDEEDDDKKSDIDVAEYDNGEQNVEDNTNLIRKSVFGLDDIEASANAKAEKDSFATTDLIETDVANRVVDTEKREENLYI